jgi:adenylate kinase
MNMIIFGPNGSGKGTQGAAIQKKYSLPHIESGVIFRDQIKKETDLGKKAQAFIAKGELVPDAITIPMILNRLREKDALQGWLLDGFPRNPAQAQALWEALVQAKIPLDYVIEIVLDRETAKKRIMGRRLCPVDNNHPNNLFIPEIAPKNEQGRLTCRVCGQDNLLARPDDQDEEAIDKRHGIYYDAEKGTLGAVAFFRQHGPVISVDGTPSVGEVSREIFLRLP